MINTILDIIRLLNDGNIVPMQKDEDTKIDLYNEKRHEGDLLKNFIMLRSLESLIKTNAHCVERILRI